MNNTIQTYYIVLGTEDELVIDVDDLEGIIQQLDALSLGYDAMGFSCTDYDDKPLWKWEAK